MFAKSRLLWLLVALPLWGCGESATRPTPPADEIVNHSGEVRLIGTDLHILVDRTEPGRQYAPTNLPTEFRQDGLLVIFSGRTLEIPPNVRMAGTPLRLSSIQRDIR